MERILIKESASFTQIDKVHKLIINIVIVRAALYYAEVRKEAYTENGQSRLINQEIESGGKKKVRKI